jgi:hypothetical protein
MQSRGLDRAQAQTAGAKWSWISISNLSPCVTPACVSFYR